MQTKKKNIQELNSFGISIHTDKYLEIKNENEIPKLSSLNDKLLLLGGGSNILFTESPSETLVHINTKGIETVDESDNFIWLEVQSGENWNDFVQWCLSKNYGGIENLSLIPGNVGTAPIQNIGAYGVEVKSTIEKVYYYDLQSGEKISLSKEDCNFAYRNSIFKEDLKGRAIISSVVFKLSKKDHELHLEYGIISQRLEEQGKSENPTIQDISRAVISIRQEKLPNPKETGNAGSFFKNPIISQVAFGKIQEKYPNIPSYPSESGVKVPAGWLIDKCGLKGFGMGNAGVHKNQALVLINKTGKASGQEVFALAKHVQNQVFETYGIQLEMEVNIYPHSFL